MIEWTVHEVDDPSSLHASFFTPSRDAHSTRHRLRLSHDDPRWRTTFLVASRHRGSDPIAAIPLARPQQARWHDPAYDPRRWGCHLNTDDPRDYLLVAGTSDFREVVLLAPSSDEVRAAALDRLWKEVVAVGCAEDRLPVARYLSARGPLATAAHGSGASLRLLPDGHRYVIPDVGRDLSSYLQHLDRGKRDVVRRDLRNIALRGFTTVATSWDSLPAWVPEAVSAVRARHAPSHPRLVSYRLDRLAADPDAEQVAFISESEAGVRAVTLGWSHPGRVELYEVGLAGPPDGQREAYLEVMFYAPLRHLWTLGGGALDLALEAERPKRLRGAQQVPLQAVVAHAAFGLEDDQEAKVASWSSA